MPIQSHATMKLEGQRGFESRRGFVKASARHPTKKPEREDRARRPDTLQHTAPSPRPCLGRMRIGEVVASVRKGGGA